MPPPVVFTVTETGPAEPAGLVAVQLPVVQDVGVTPFEPKNTVSLAAVVSKFDPLIVTVVPPCVGPCVGLMLPTVGTEAAEERVAGRRTTMEARTSMTRNKKRISLRMVPLTPFSSPVF